MADEPAYGRRVSREELAQILREQGLDHLDQPAPGLREPTPPSTRPSPGDGPLPAGSGRARPGRWRLLLVGLVMMLVLPVVLLVAASQYVLGPGLSSVAAVPQSGSVYLTQGRQVAVYSSQVGASTTHCEVADPGGASVATSSVPSLPYATFTAPVSGLYQISCPGGPASSQLMVGPPLDLSRAWVMLVGMLLAGLVGLIGLGLSIAGAVRAWRG